jgi:hypothetical protein
MNTADFLLYILPEVAGCPSETARVALMRTADEFCRLTGCWREYQTPINLIDKVAVYDIDIPNTASCVTVLEVRSGNRILVPKTMQEINRLAPDWPTAKSQSPAYYNSPDSENAIRVYPTPDLPNEQLIVRATYTPKLASATLPDFLTTRYGPALEAGTKARLTAMRNQQWSDAAFSDRQRSVYDRLREQARIDVIHERVAGTLRVTPQRFGF